MEAQQIQPPPEFKIQRSLVGFGFFYAPTIFAKLGALGGTCLVLAVTLLNYYSVWLVSKTESRFRNEFFNITSVYDLTTIVFGDAVVILQQVLRIANSMCQLLLMAMVLGVQLSTEADLAKKKLHQAAVVPADVLKAVHLTPKLISTGFIFLIVVVFASAQIAPRTQRIMQTIAALAFAVAGVLLAFHLRMQAKETLLADIAAEVARPDLLTDPRFSMLDFVALASIAVSMFDGNQQMLLAKAEMEHRPSFGCVALLAHLVYGVLVVAAGFFVWQIGGATTLFECLKPHSDLTHVLACLLLFCCLVWFMLTSQDLHSCMQRLYILATRPAPTTRNSHLNQILSAPDYTKDLGMTTNFLLICLPMSIVSYAAWHVKADAGILMVAGGVFGTTLLVLYPILLFNKSYGSGQQDFCCRRAMNWLLFAAAIGVGGFGAYKGVRQLM